MSDAESIFCYHKYFFYIYLGVDVKKMFCIAGPNQHCAKMCVDFLAAVSPQFFLHIS